MKPVSMGVVLGMSLCMVACMGTVTPTLAGGPTQAQSISLTPDVPGGREPSVQSKPGTSAAAVVFYGAPVPPVGGLDTVGTSRPTTTLKAQDLIPRSAWDTDATVAVEALSQDPLKPATLNYGSGDGDPTDDNLP